MKIALAALALTGLAFAQVRTTADSTPTAEGNVPIYRVTVTSRTAQAVNYRHRGGATKVNFQGTVVAQQSRGEAKVESKKGYIEVEVEFDDLPAPQKLGPEYLTYVMWAISPEGRATNMGEILLNSEGEGKLNVTTELQSFGMIVTAEPYFAVTQPSDMVVMENVVRRDTLGKTEVIDAKYELLKRGSYPNRPAESALRNLPGDPSKTPIYLWEARNAVQIARWTGADKYAAESFRKAEDQLRQAEDYHRRKQEKPTSMVAREAVQTAEDARLIALQRQEEERLAQERAAAAEREAAERARADEARRQRELAEQQTKLAEQQARLEAERRAAADAQRQAAVTERMAAERAKAEADQARLAAERAQQEALTQQQALAAQAAQARQAAQDAERARASAEAEKQQLRDQLRQQLNMVLETRESARGLIVNMSDVLFDFGKYTLRPGTREKLARVSGILLTHPSLRIEVEGHTDNVGSDEFNQKLSEQRASTVREYLVGNGVPANMITAKGLGEATPVTTNDTAQGRQQNRRVELVVSGEAIGTGQQPSATLR